MAPSSNATMTLQQNRPRPAAARRVVPAIPLPYLVQKRKQQEAALAKAREQDATPVQEEAVEASSLNTPPPDEISPTVVDASQENEAEVADSSTAPTSPEIPANSTTPAVEESVEMEAAEEGSSIHEETAELAIEAPRSTPSDSQSSASRSTYQMPPPFVPANQQQSNGRYHGYIAASQTNTLNGEMPMFQGHLRNGGSVSNGYPASNTSSPAPISAGGFMPPPYQQQLPLYPQNPGGRHAPHLSNGGHSQQMSNGYSAMGPPHPPPGGFYPAPDGFMNPTSDWASRHGLPPNGQAGGFSPSGTPGGLDGQPPSTPRSIHGSQTSFNNDRENVPAFHGHYPVPTAIISNGSNGVNDVQLYHPMQAKPQDESQPLASNAFVGPSPTIDQFDGLPNYIQSTFADSTFADYTLILSYTDGRTPPVRLPGHGLIFARSATLNSLMRDVAADHATGGLRSRDLLLETGDRFITTDGFWLAMQRLYCHPLIDHHIFERLNPKNAFEQKQVDKLNLALSYAASGHLLQMPSVVARGLDLAVIFLNFNNLERLLEFALDGGLESQWTMHDQNVRSARPSTYGPGVNSVIYRCLAFLIANFPVRPSSDLSFGEVSHNSRLPFVSGAPNTAGARSATHNPRLSQIKFGDHGGEREITDAATTLSVIARVLLNLPFHLLKFVLESNLASTTEGWSNPSVRHELMSSVVSEREKRRLKTHASNTPNAERQVKQGDWDVVGWEEKVEVDEQDHHSPYLIRSWVGFEVIAPSS